MKQIYTFSLITVFILVAIFAACEKKVEVESITLAPPQIYGLAVSETQSFIAIVKPTDATNKRVTWKSYNEDIATIDTHGKVTGIASGTTTIQCTAVGGDVSVYALVSVK